MVDHGKSGLKCRDAGRDQRSSRRREALPCHFYRVDALATIEGGSAQRADGAGLESHPCGPVERWQRGPLTAEQRQTQTLDAEAPEATVGEHTGPVRRSSKSPAPRAPGRSAGRQPERHDRSTTSGAMARRGNPTPRAALGRGQLGGGPVRSTVRDERHHTRPGPRCCRFGIPDRPSGPTRYQAGHRPRWWRRWPRRRRPEWAMMPSPRARRPPPCAQNRWEARSPPRTGTSLR